MQIKYFHPRIWKKRDLRGNQNGKRNVHFPKAIKKPPQSHEWTHESDHTTAVIVPSDRGERDGRVGVTWASSWWMQLLWSSRHALLDPCDGETSPGHFHSRREVQPAGLKLPCETGNSSWISSFLTEICASDLCSSGDSDWNGTVWTEILIYESEKRAEGKIPTKKSWSDKSEDESHTCWRKIVLYFFKK